MTKSEALHQVTNFEAQGKGVLSSPLRLKFSRHQFRRRGHSLRLLFEKLAELSPDVAQQFFDRPNLLEELTRVELRRFSARSALHYRASFQLSDRYFAALAAVKAGDLDFFVV